MFRRVFTSAMLASLLTAASPAYAWQEAHQTANDAKLAIAPDGTATVEHAVGYRIVRGPLKGFELGGVPKGIAVEPDVAVTTDDGRELKAHAELGDQNTLHVWPEDPKSLIRGAYVFRVKYRLDFVASHALARDGAMWKLTWQAPIAPEGLDGTKVAFAFPPAPTEPRAVRIESGNADDSVIAKLTRAPDKDELELVRPHVARGEAPTLAVRVDPKAFPAVTSPALRPPVSIAPAPASTPATSATWTLVGLVAIFGALFGALVIAKDRAFARSFSDLSGKKSPNLGIASLPIQVRAAVSGIGFASAVACAASGRLWIAALAAAVAMAAATLLAPRVKAAPRGPGRWLALRPDDAFGSKVSPILAPFDVDARSGKLLLASLFVALIVLSRFLVASHPGPWGAIVFGVLMICPIVLTGSRTQLPPHLARTAASHLAPLFRDLVRDLAKGGNVRVVPWGRLPLQSSSADELRLLLLPRGAMPGLFGIEVGVAFAAAWRGVVPVGEVLVRVQEGSPAARWMNVIGAASRPVPGRREDERVFALRSTPATVSGAADVARTVAARLVDRRDPHVPATQRASERRRASSSRIATAAAA